MGCENERGRLRYNNEGYPYPATGEAGTVGGRAGGHTNAKEG